LGNGGTAAHPRLQRSLDHRPSSSEAPGERAAAGRGPSWLTPAKLVWSSPNDWRQALPAMDDSHGERALRTAGKKPYRRVTRIGLLAGPLSTGPYRQDA
jgi:hypothetical protein